MNQDIAAKLVKLNKEFYAQFAMPFADSRSSPQPGFHILLDHLPGSCDRVLDVGCGNGRFGRFLKAELLTFEYTGIDFASELLLIAGDQLQGSFYEREISQPGFLEGLGKFDLIVCLATMQHVPGRSNRMAMLREMRNHLSENGLVFLSNWQFLDSPRQRRKIKDWTMVKMSVEDIEPGDYLLSWQREGSGLRYVCAIDVGETDYLARTSGLRITSQFRSDGREGNLNLYTVLSHENRHNIE